MTTADRIVVLNGGRVEQIDTLVDVFDRPGHVFVAGFMGSPETNLLPRLVDGDALVVAGRRLHRPEGLRDGQRPRSGLRPEHTRLGHGAADRVAVVEPTGAEKHPTPGLSRASLTVVTKERPAVADAGSIRVNLESAPFHPFDAGSGCRI
jgi:multiple sugar transport system ATP-binding protein